MPYLRDIAYSCEATITATRDDYHFLTEMYLPESVVIEPLADGWPNITRESMRDIGKTGEVVELLRHLPYTNGYDKKWRDLQGAPYTVFADWQSLRSDEVQYLTEG